jgi:cell division protein FtsA
MILNYLWRKARRGRPKHICALDIGTTKICALIGHVDDKGAMSVLGFGSCQSPGLNHGNVTDIESTAEAIERALSQAEDLARVRGREAVVGIAGDHIQSINAEATIEIAHHERGIGTRDRSRVIKKARNSLTVPADKEMIHVTPQHFIVNGNNRVYNPVGHSSRFLGVQLHVILASEASVRNIWRCVQKAGLRPREMVFESLASSMSVLSNHERELGVVLLDIGGGTTDVALFKDGCIRATGEVDLGGNSMTQDIQYMWRLSFHDAENLKKRAGSAVWMDIEADERVNMPTLHPTRKPETKKRRELAAIIEARVEEIMDIAKPMVEREIDLNKVLAGVVLTGGSAMLDGIDKVAERVFGLKCRIGFPQGIRGMSGALGSPIYSTGVGLLNFGHDDDFPPVPVRSTWRRRSSGWKTGRLAFEG